ncbi:helix-turn-helix domain-containing protein [Furfurilactobacillus curtus]
MHTGSTIRQIRLDKQLKANTVYDNLLSRSMYYKYEHGQVETNAASFLEILERLNVTLDEFQLMFNDQDHEREDYQSLVVRNNNAFISGDEATIQLVVKEANQHYLKTNNLKFKHLALLGAGLIKRLRRETNFEPESTEILNYLFKNENWMYYELTLFNNSFFMFDINVVDMLFKRVLQRMDFYKQLNTEHDEVTLMICNIVLKAIEDGAMNVANRFFVLLKHRKRNVTDMFSRSVLMFYEGIDQIFHGQRNQGIAQAERTINIFESLEMTNAATQHQAILQRVLAMTPS